MGTPLTFVTVTYRGEDELLRLQTRSLARYGHDGIERIIVIDNGRPQLSGRRKAHIVRDYGKFADRVEVVPAETLSNKLQGLSGWTAQQVLKLNVSRIVDTPWYVLLDAKNHAIRQLTQEDLIGPDGRARGGFHDYANHPLKDRLHATLDYLKLPASAADMFPPTSTPFVMHTATAKEIVDSIPDLETQIPREGLTEFALYSGWILRRDGNWDAVFDGTAIQCPTLWGRTSTDGIVEQLGNVEYFDAPFFGVHRRFLRRASSEDFSRVAHQWVTWSLAKNTHDANSIRRKFLVEHVSDAAVSRARSMTRKLRVSMPPALVGRRVGGV